MLGSFGLLVTDFFKCLPLHALKWSVLTMPELNWIEASCWGFFPAACMLPHPTTTLTALCGSATNPPPPIPTLNPMIYNVCLFHKFKLNLYNWTTNYKCMRKLAYKVILIIGAIKVEDPQQCPKNFNFPFPLALEPWWMNELHNILQQPQISQRTHTLLVLTNRDGSINFTE